MHFESAPIPVTGPPDPDPDAGLPWYKGLTSYHWLVFTVASLGWLFDTMDQQLFVLARKPAVTELLKASPGDPRVELYSGYATSIFMIGWALGGLVFGVMGDRVGRAKTMILTILLYSLFTGLSAFSWDVTSLSVFRFLTGLGVGGEFAVGIALVAEVMPDRSRPSALAWLQALSAVGNMGAALINIGLGVLESQKALGHYTTWRIEFVIGVLPAFLAFAVFRRVKEPERWRAAAARRAEAKASGVAQAEGEKLGSLVELFGNPRWRKNTIVGMILAFSGVVGLWGIGFFSPDLTRTVFRNAMEKQGVAQDLIGPRLTLWAGVVSLLQNAGGFLGVYTFGRFTYIMGRRPAFAISFLLAITTTATVFWFLKSPSDVFWMIPLMGFGLMTLFGGYAVYLAELFPTRLRSSGISFCYSVGRFVAALGPTMLGVLTSQVYKGYPEPLRYAGVTMCSVFLLGLAVLPFAPETKGKPLPE